MMAKAANARQAGMASTTTTYRPARAHSTSDGGGARTAI